MYQLLLSLLIAQVHSPFKVCPWCRRNRVARAPFNMAGAVSPFTWLHLFLVLFAVGGAFITASNQQTVTNAVDSLRMPAGGGAVKRGDTSLGTTDEAISTATTRTAFGTSPPLTQQQAHATDIVMEQVAPAGEKVCSGSVLYT